MTQEWIMKTLESLGFKQIDAEVYDSLMRNGSQKAAEIAKMLKTYKWRVYHSLNTLQTRGIVKANLERPTKFTAVSFDEVLDALIKENVQEAKRMEKQKEELLTQWRTMIGHPSTSAS